MTPLVLLRVVDLGKCDRNDINFSYTWVEHERKSLLVVLEEVRRAELIVQETWDDDVVVTDSNCDTIDLTAPLGAQSFPIKVYFRMPVIEELRQVTVIVRIRPRAQDIMDAYADRILGAVRCDADGQPLVDTEEQERALAWRQLSRSSPELLEIVDVELESLTAGEVEWACGECSKPCDVLRAGHVPDSCSSCGAFLLVEAARSAHPSWSCQNIGSGGGNDASRTIDGPRQRGLTHTGTKPGIAKEESFQVTILTARRFYNMDLEFLSNGEKAPTWSSLSDDWFVECRSSGTHSNSFRTDSAKESFPLDPVWNHEATAVLLAKGDDLDFAIWNGSGMDSSHTSPPVGDWDALNERRYCLGRATISSKRLRDDGDFEGELVLEPQELTLGARLIVRVVKASMVGESFSFSLMFREIGVSIVSVSERQEMFFTRLSKLQLHFSRSRQHEQGRLVVGDIRVDCQKRVARRRRHRTIRQGWHRLKRWRHAVMEPTIFRDLVETPSVLASVPLARDRATKATASTYPCFEVRWDRPVLEGAFTRLCVKSFRFTMHKRWELTVDTLTAQALLSLHTEIADALVDTAAGGETKAQELQFAFKRLRGTANTRFVNSFVPPEALPVVQAERVEISQIEITVWGSIELSRLRMVSMPATLVFILQLLSMRDTLCVDSKDIVLSEWALPEMRWSVGQIVVITRNRYQVSLMFFLASVFGSSNLLQLIGMPLLLPARTCQLVLGGVAKAVSALDTTILSIVPASQMPDGFRDIRNNEENVDSMEECMVDFGRNLIGGVFGIKDVFIEPARGWRERGVIGVPRGFCMGVISAIVKLVHGLLQAVRALFQAMSAACGGKIRKRPRRQQEALPALTRRDVHRDADLQGGASYTSTEHGEDTIDESPASSVSRPFAAIRRAVEIRPRLETLRHPSARHEPFLKGQPELRMPRLLFGYKEAVLKPYEAWHAELLALFGADVAEGISAAWELSGGPDESAHIVLYACRCELVLVNLNCGRIKKRHRRRRTQLKTNLFSNEDVLEVLRSRAADRRQLLEERHRAGCGTPKRRGLSRRQEDLEIDAVGIHSAEQAEIARIRDLHVLGSWIWTDLKSVEITEEDWEATWTNNNYECQPYRMSRRFNSPASRSSPTVVGQPEERIFKDVSLSDASPFDHDSVSSSPDHTRRHRAHVRVLYVQEEGHSDYNIRWPIPLFRSKKPSLSSEALGAINQGIMEVIRAMKEE